MMRQLRGLVRGHRLTRPLVELHATLIIDGLPMLEPSLGWPGTSVHLAGRPARLVLGPAAGNLWGARMAARAIADRVVTALNRSDAIS